MHKLQTLRRVVKMLVEEVVEEQPPESPSQIDLSGNFVPWPDEVSGVPYSATADFGKGEVRLARLLGFKDPQGKNVPYDLSGQVNGVYKRFEVKEPNKDSLIRAGGHSVLHAMPILTKLTAVCDQLNDAMDLLVADAKSKGDDEEKLIDNLPPGILQATERFLTKDTKEILKGNFGPVRRDALLNILDGFQMFFENSIDQKTWTVSVGNHRVENVDTQTYIKVAKLLGLSTEEMDVTLLDEIMTALDGDAFSMTKDGSSPTIWMQRLWEASDASKTFELVDGMFLVSPSGYRYLPKESFDSKLAFAAFAAGRATFKVKP